MMSSHITILKQSADFLTKNINFMQPLAHLPSWPLNMAPCLHMSMHVHTCVYISLLFLKDNFARYLIFWLTDFFPLEL